MNHIISVKDFEDCEYRCRMAGQCGPHQDIDKYLERITVLDIS